MTAVTPPDSQAFTDLPAELKDELQKQNASTCNGFFILCDIISSTARKQEYHTKWVLHTETICVWFGQVMAGLATDLKQDVTVLKFMGDGMMAFIKTGDSEASDRNCQANPDHARKVYDVMDMFLAKLQEHSEEFCGLRLKTVITYLTEVSLIDLHDEKKQSRKDVLGRGVDFTFRLERYAAASHIVLNKMMYDALAETLTVERKEDLIMCQPCRYIKGWEAKGPQTFGVIAKTDQLKEAFSELTGDPHDPHITYDVLSQYFKKSVDNNTASVNNDPSIPSLNGGVHES